MSFETVSVVIDQPYDEVYGFLVDPMNFPSWGPVKGTEIHHLSGGDWLIELENGPHVLRFVAPNLDGVLDYWLFGAGQPPGEPIEVRLSRHGEASELSVVWRRQEAPDAVFAEQLEEVRRYLQRLKRLLEAEPAP